MTGGLTISGKQAAPVSSGGVAWKALMDADEPSNRPKLRSISVWQAHHIVERSPTYLLGPQSHPGDKQRTYLLSSKK